MADGPGESVPQGYPPLRVHDGHDSDADMNADSQKPRIPSPHSTKTEASNHAEVEVSDGCENKDEEACTTMARLREDVLESHVSKDGMGEGDEGTFGNSGNLGKTEEERYDTREEESEDERGGDNFNDSPGGYPLRIPRSGMADASDVCWISNGLYGKDGNNLTNLELEVDMLLKSGTDRLEEDLQKREDAVRLENERLRLEHERIVQLEGEMGKGFHRWKAERVSQLENELEATTQTVQELQTRLEFAMREKTNCMKNRTTFEYFSLLLEAKQDEMKEITERATRKEEENRQKVSQLESELEATTQSLQELQTNFESAKRERDEIEGIRLNLEHETARLKKDNAKLCSLPNETESCQIKESLHKIEQELQILTHEVAQKERVLREREKTWLEEKKEWSARENRLLKEKEEWKLKFLVEQTDFEKKFYSKTEKFAHELNAQKEVYEQRLALERQNFDRELGSKVEQLQLKMDAQSKIFEEKLHLQNQELMEIKNIVLISQSQSKDINQFLSFFEDDFYSLINEGTDMALLGIQKSNVIKCHTNTTRTFDLNIVKQKCEEILERFKTLKKEYSKMWEDSQHLGFKVTGLCMAGNDLDRATDAIIRIDSMMAEYLHSKANNTYSRKLIEIYNSVRDITAILSRKYGSKQKNVWNVEPGTQS